MTLMILNLISRNILSRYTKGKKYFLNSLLKCHFMIYEHFKYVLHIYITPKRLLASDNILNDNAIVHSCGWNVKSLTAKHKCQKLVRLVDYEDIFLI